MSLYTVRFTTKKIITRYNLKREKIAEINEEVPVTLTGLPKETALQYKGCDNFTMEAEIVDTSKKSVYRRPRDKEEAAETYRTHTSSRPAKPKSTLEDAAATGDMAAAINS